jgi:hypothetical protein
LKKEVKYLGIVVGYTYDGQTIEFLDNKEAQQIKENLMKGQSIGISSRRMGTVDESGKVNYKKIIEYGIINHFDELKDSKQ